MTPTSTPTTRQGTDHTTRTGSSRTRLITASIIGAAIVNLALFFGFGAAGAGYHNTMGMTVGVPNVLGMTVIPLLIGLGAVVLLSRRWPVLRAVGRWVGVALALLTIGMTATAGFDTLSFLALALMHLVVAAAITTALAPAKH
jgi:hypothetical protein